MHYHYFLYRFVCVNWLNSVHYDCSRGIPNMENITALSERNVYVEIFFWNKKEKVDKPMDRLDFPRHNFTFIFLTDTSSYYVWVLYVTFGGAYVHNSYIIELWHLWVSWITPYPPHTQPLNGFPVQADQVLETGLELSFIIYWLRCTDSLIIMDHFALTHNANDNNNFCLF